MHGDRRAGAPSLVNSPQFRLDLTPARPLDEGFRFSHAEPVKTPSVRTVTLNVSYTLARLLFASQCLIVFTLVLLIGGMSYTMLKMSNSAYYYVNAVQPYVDEARERSMHILRSADESAISIHNIATEAESVGATSMPAIAEALNRTTDAVSHMAALMRHPTVRMTVE